MPVMFWILGLLFLSLAVYCFVTGSMTETTSVEIDSSSPAFFTKKDPAYLVGNGKVVHLFSTGVNFTFFQKQGSVVATGTPNPKYRQIFEADVETVSGCKYYVMGSDVEISSDTPQTIVFEEEPPRENRNLSGLVCLVFGLCFFSPLIYKLFLLFK